MEVILKENVAKLGRAGEVVKVREGFARNFLIPQGKAVLADPKNIKELEHHKKLALQAESKLKKQAENLSLQIASLNLSISRESGEDGKLFGSVASKDIVEALSKEKIHIERKQMDLEQPIKQLGDYEIGIQLHPEVKATLKLSVVAK